MKNTRTMPESFIPYKTVAFTPTLLNVFSQKHNTKNGTWGKIMLTSNDASFEFLNANNDVLSRTHIEKNTPFIVPPATWHRLITKTKEDSGSVTFYCHPQDFFFKKYKTTKPHSEVVILQSKYLTKLFDASKKLDIFDMGCGRGRNSLYLSQHGHNMLSADKNEKQIDFLNNVIENENIKNIKTKVVDLENLEITQKFDAVILYVVMQFLNADKVWNMLNIAQKNTKVGGLHSIVCPVVTDGVSWPKSFSFFLESEQLRNFYLDKSWAILEYNESFGHLHKNDEHGLPIRGKFASIIAQKIL